MAKILLVEDNEMNRDMLSRRLMWRGYLVVLATDGRHGIEVAEAEAPDLVLMDMSLPEMDGWEATRRLKNDPRTRHIPIVALTGHALAGHAEGAREAGCDAFVTKPCLPDALVAEIKRLLDAQRGNAENVKDPARAPRSTKKRS
jgi:two-component system cell cycle response regulator DivK